ncbi:IS30 family transposase [Spiroplasma endosymbiont of Polydrusus formosus]|uniref:IS30 family transposase n=1 Tax=Spiroplasma endosymbiont of Polydrusus formosus TaxID=3139326 RepID=UPI0035B51F3F
MKKFKNLIFNERDFFNNLLLSDACKKKNGEINLSEIARQTRRNINTDKKEIKRFKNIQDYKPSDVHKYYKQKRKKCIKKIPEFTKKQLDFIKTRFNKYHDTLEQLIYRYFIEFGVKFSAYVKTLYKWIRLGKLGLRKENSFHHGKKYKIKQKPDNCGKLINFKSIWDFKNKAYSVGWFEIYTVVGKNHQYSCLILFEQSSNNYFAVKLKNHSYSEIVTKFKDIVINNNLIGKMKGIITDQGKEFSKWREMEIFTETQVYFCDPSKPQQKPLIEHMNGEFRYWLPKGTDFNNVSQKIIDLVVNVINDKLRPCLNWRTSKEVFLNNFR